MRGIDAEWRYQDHRDGFRSSIFVSLSGKGNGDSHCFHADEYYHLGEHG